ncbi:hypothetical protein POTOM_007132 [Populus tomentosa]|uniref:Glycosyltransferase family 92 protein n=1 Tax=Populus tomentosa TaxID=118781 RepID=A0A8X8AJG2_POPTO|nr:hypothetical protein POTOM_007132 [Populus tomentosa]
MVFDVAKFLREWVVYHSKIGVEKFVLYDNDSDDDLMKVIKELNQEGYSIERTPGLGFEAAEPAGWENMFCEHEDKRLKLLTQRWLRKKTMTGYFQVSDNIQM